MKRVETIYDQTKVRRVIVFARDDGSFGFQEERFSDDPMENAWLPFGRYSITRCDTAARALAEARARISWLGHAQPA